MKRLHFRIGGLEVELKHKSGNTSLARRLEHPAGGWDPHLEEARRALWTRFFY